jgi:hypothetical protein
MRKCSILVAVFGSMPIASRDSSRDTQDWKKDVVINILSMSGVIL